MARAELVAIEVERFKSYRKHTRLELAPLTVLLGRNNSGKSTLIQALLLLKQTLAHPRKDVPLHLQGAVHALSLRELTAGWPQDDEFSGPSIAVEWRSEVNVKRALEKAGWPDIANLVKHSGIKWLEAQPETVVVTTRLCIDYRWEKDRIRIERISVRSTGIDNPDEDPRIVSAGSQFRIDSRGTPTRIFWGSSRAWRIAVDFEHFLPFLLIYKSELGPRSRERSWYNGYLVAFEQPLEDLRALLERFAYLGSMRALPPPVYSPVTVPPTEIGVSGEYAAEMLHARQSDMVHYLPPLRVTDEGVHVPDTVEAKPLLTAVNDVMTELGVPADVRIEDVQNIGFRLLLGNATLAHVGRGVSYLLPVVQLGLVSDPYGFGSPSNPVPLAQYQRILRSFRHAAVEEPETHTHPKVQTRLAHWFVSLAMSGRRLIVETHSDHMVRRLRGLIARADNGGELEKWLANNVLIAEVEQDEDGHSSLQCSRLTPGGGISEHWPAEFMDEAGDEERAIYYAGLDKQPEAADYASEAEFIHDPEPL